MLAPRAAALALLLIAAPPAAAVRVMMLIGARSVFGGKPEFSVEGAQQSDRVDAGPAAGPADRDDPGDRVPQRRVGQRILRPAMACRERSAGAQCQGRLGPGEQCKPLRARALQ